MVQVIPNWFVSGDDLAAVAPKSLQRHIKLLEDHCTCQRMPEDVMDVTTEDGGGVLEYEEAHGEEEAYGSAAALADFLHNNAEEEKEDWSAQIRSIHYDMPRDEVAADIPVEEDTQSVSGISGIVTSCSEATAEATNVAVSKETTPTPTPTTPATISISKSQEPAVYHDAKSKAATSPASHLLLIPLQVMIPASIITGDDVAQIAPESCQSPIRYMEDHCICQRMPDHDPAPPPPPPPPSSSSRTRATMMAEFEEEEKKRDDDDDDDDDNDAMILDFERNSCIRSNPEKAHMFIRNLNARAPLEPPNPKKPGESHFIEEDMMDLLETV
ncbi:MAG: hypothetical protein SGBAC_010500 [Bacillariaceae sp.]